jgi:cutinase
MRNSILLAGALAMVVSASPMPTPQRPGGGCKKVVLIFARGSTEPGTMGMTVGPALSSALERKFGAANFMSQGVSYPASIDGAVSGAINPAGAPGSKDMTKKVKAIFASCPDTKIILSGYSQGAEQVHGSLQKDNLGPDGAKIAAAITYGDPMAGERTKMLGGWGCLPESRALVNCAKGDGVCTGAFSISAAHMSYTGDGSIAKGVNFAAQIINGGKLEGNPGGECKYGISAADLQNMKGAGGTGGAPGTGGSAPPTSSKGSPKGKGKGGSGGMPKGGSGMSPPPAAASPAPAPVASSEHEGMEGM